MKIEALLAQFTYDRDAVADAKREANEQIAHQQELGASIENSLTQLDRFIEAIKPHIWRDFQNDPPSESNTSKPILVWTDAAEVLVANADTPLPHPPMWWKPIEEPPVTMDYVQDAKDVQDAEDELDAEEEEPAE